MDRIRPFLEAGIGHVGENRVQEGESKWGDNSKDEGGGGRGEKSEIREQMAESRKQKAEGPVLHLIGPLQSNKVKKAVGLFDMIQTLDRWDLAEEINRHAQALGKVQDCLIQIKISDEPSKSGLDPSALPDLLSRLSLLSHIRVRGLMGIPPYSAQGDAARPYFQKLRRLFEDSRVTRPEFDTLSMGMSSDFETAIEEGATMVRLGTVIFGSRQ